MIVHTCSCGETHTLEQWRKLPLRGVQTFSDGLDPPKLEIRNCVCGSTRALEINNDGEPWSITEDKQTARS